MWTFEIIDKEKAPEWLFKVSEIAELQKGEMKMTTTRAKYITYHFETWRILVPILLSILITVVTFISWKHQGYDEENLSFSTYNLIFNLIFLIMFSKWKVVEK